MDARPRNYPNGLGDARGPPSRPSTAGARGPPSTTSASSAPAGMSRAERFDDERRRITESCFAKVDEQGQLQESYITHIRVQEDGGFPQSPPPPNAPTSSKKARIIMISVRNTGRVKLHKARENANGSFSIGKSWPMEELSAVENYVHLSPASDEDAQRKQWAGDKGFTVTVTKPYYWEAGTAKEKEFFIGSLVKIYNKYTKGDFPILTGFGVAELNSLTNGKPHLASPEGRAAFAAGGSKGASPDPQRQGSADQRSLPPKSPGPPPRRPMESPGMSPEEGRRGLVPTASNPNFRRPPGDYQGPRRPGQPDDQFRPGSRPGTGDEGRRPPPFAPNQGTPPLPDLRQKRSMEQSIRSRPSGDSMRMRPGPGQGRDPIPPTPPFPSNTLTPQSSTSEFAGRPRTPDSINIPAGLSPGRRPPVDDARSQRSMDSSQEGAAPPILPLEQRRQNGMPPPRRDPSPRGLRPGTAQSNGSSNFTRNDDLPPEEPPQRRRPLMEPRPSQASQRSLESQGTEPRSVFYTPSGSPGPPPMDPPPRRRPQEIPERLKPAVQNSADPAEEPLPPTRSAQPTPPPTAPLPQLPPALIQQETQSVESAPAAQPTPTDLELVQSNGTPTEDKENEVAHRPGLGPMVKKPVITADAANKFRKAAAAAGAFKPRVGGAAAKLFNKDIKTTDEADGVNAVFVPQRPTPKEPSNEEVEQIVEVAPQVAPKLPDRSSKERPRISTEVVPSVTVSSPLLSTPASVIPEVNEPPPPTPEKAASRKIETVTETRRKKRRSNQQISNISKLGIDPRIIDERGLEFESLLSELGWGSNELSAKNIESLEIDIKREITRVEAGSWLNNLDQKDDRVEAVERMLDRAIAECDELEGLLTLYNVELSVSCSFKSPLLPL